MEKKYSFKDDFEMLIVRHDYLRKIKKTDPRWVKEFKPIVAKTSWIMFNKFNKDFTRIGYEIEDIENIANCYMLAYMSLYSLRENSEKLEKIKNTYEGRFGKSPDQDYLDKKEKINMISFLRQKLQHAAVVCSRKLRNISVDTEKKAVYAHTDRSIPIPLSVIYREGEKHGYRRVTKDEFKKIKKDTKENQRNTLLDSKGYPVLEINLPNEGLSSNDYRDLFVNSQEDSYHNEPESFLINRESILDMQSYKNKFKKMEMCDKKRCLKDFIEKHRGDSRYMVELKVAKKIINRL